VVIDEQFNQFEHVFFAVLMDESTQRHVEAEREIHAVPLSETPGPSTREGFTTEDALDIFFR
jgi:hypothetical protein